MRRNSAHPKKSAAAPKDRRKTLSYYPNIRLKAPIRRATHLRHGTKQRVLRRPRPAGSINNAITMPVPENQSFQYVANCFNRKSAMVVKYTDIPEFLKIQINILIYNDFCGREDNSALSNFRTHGSNKPEYRISAISKPNMSAFFTPSTLRRTNIVASARIPTGFTTGTIIAG